MEELHLATDADTGQIIASVLTDKDADDGSQVGPLLERIDGVLVHKSAVGRGSAAAIAVYQAMRCDTGMPSRVIRLSAEQATRASVFWLGRVRARRPRPMMVLYRNTAVSPSERLP